MNKNDICRYIDNTLLKQYSSADDFLRFADQSIPYHFASLCVNPWAVPLVKKRIDGTDNRIATVIGFPNGISSTEVKVFETKTALDDGADEIDFVINLGLLKSGEFGAVGDEIARLKAACGSHILKCIIETCFLTNEDIVRMCHIIEDNGCDFVKTSTGFGSGGATVEHIKLIKSSLTNPSTKIKASGGIRTLEDTIAMIEAGADRIGTSGGVGIAEAIHNS